MTDPIIRGHDKELGIPVTVVAGDMYDLLKAIKQEVAALNDDWLPIDTAPRNAMWFEGRTEDGVIHRVHWAQDLSGEEQPAFRGFFEKLPDRSNFTEVKDLVGWRPIPVNPSPSDPPRTPPP